MPEPSAPPKPDSDVVANRRAQLRAWIDTHFGGKQAAFLEHVADLNGGSGVNQGELSGLLNAKHFGEKRARRLEQQAGMPPGYLDERRASDSGWPFQHITQEELARLSGPEIETVEIFIMGLLERAGVRVRDRAALVHAETH